MTSVLEDDPQQRKLPSELPSHLRRLGVCTSWPADAAVAIRPWRRAAFRERYGAGSDDFQQFGRHHAATWPGMLVHWLEMSNWEEGCWVAEGVGVSQQKQNVEWISNGQ